MEHFADNLERLMGMHKLSAKEAADMLGLSQSVLSKWQSGARQPSFSSALAAGDFFGVPADRLARADFSDLLANELAEAGRYAEVEAEIRRRRSTLREVGDTKMLGKVPKKVIAMHKADEELRAKRKETKERKES